ncbi:MAG: trigger factor [Firmicutes bacterium HGW-Firmicutes-16]|nr:MAG: trigger factor [Firmicutes bacterium HGW-Firmicutes-16]
MIVKNVEKKEKNTVSFTVEVDKDEFEEAVHSAYLKNKKKVNVPGFRHGKAPRMVIEGMYGANVFYDDAVDEISSKAFEYAVKEEKLETVGRPGILNYDVSDEKILTVEFEAGLYPEVTLGQYKGIEAPCEEINMTDADVDAYIEEIRKRNARQITVERAAELGDTAVIDYDGYLDGERFEGGKAEGTNLELGSNSFVPGFEEQVVGMKAGDEKEINITFPENYHEGLAGKAVVFKVKVHEVNKMEMPEVDDEFAKDVSEFDKLEDYRTAIMEQLVSKRRRAVEDDFGYNVLEKAVENMSVEVPDAMIEERMGVMANEYDRNLMARGMHLEEYLRMSGMDPASFQSMIRPQAEAQVKTDLLLAAVAKAENIEVTDEDIEKAVEDIAKAYGVTPEQIKQAIPADSMLDDMKKKKANDLIMQSAIPTAPVTEEVKAEKPAKKAPAKKASKKAETQTEDVAE